MSSRIAEQVVRYFISLVEAGGDGVEALMDPSATVVTHPNLFAPAGHVRSFSESAEARIRGREMAPVQRYEIRTVEEVAPDRVVVRLTWSATLAAAAGPFPTGTGLRSEIAQFFELREGRVLRLETFDCYYPPSLP